MNFLSIFKGKIVLPVSLLALIFIGASCSTAEPPVASVDKEIILVDCAGDNMPYHVMSNAEWTLTSNQSWCKPSKEGGRGTMTIQLVVSKNTAPYERTATLTLTCNGRTTKIEVTQTGTDSSLLSSPEAATIDHAQQYVSFAVMSNRDWKALSSTEGAGDEGNWAIIETDNKAGDGNGLVKIKCLANKSYTERTAVISVFVSSTAVGTPSNVKTFTITQLAQGLPSLTVATNAVNFAQNALTSASNTISVPVISNITNITAATDFSWCNATVTNNMVNISVTSDNTTNAPRMAIVTVSGNVDGKLTTKQISVTQAGMASPSLTLLTENIVVSEKRYLEYKLNWINIPNASVHATTTESWLRIESETQTGCIIEINANQDAATRVGTIDLIASSGEQSVTYHISVMQLGVGAPNISFAPQSIVASSEGHYQILTGVINNPSASLIREPILSAEWVEASTEGLPFVSNTFAIMSEVTIRPNVSDKSRESTITYPIKIGNQQIFYPVKVFQNGMGAPAVSTNEQIFMQCDQTAHSQSIWRLKGDDLNVSYKVSHISYAPGVTNQTTATSQWITSAKIVDGQLVIATTKNTDNETRDGSILIIATRENSNTILNVSVKQAGHKSAGISAATQEIFVNYLGVTNASYPFSALNNSVVTVVSKPSWVSNATVDAITNNAVTYTVDAFAGGIAGDFREGTITLSANNGNSNVEYYQIKVRQYSPSAATLDVPSTITIPYAANNSLTLSFSKKNSATVTASIEDAANNSWLTLPDAIDGVVTVLDAANSVKYAVTAYSGNEPSREAKIVLKASNKNANTQYYYVTICQTKASQVTLTSGSGIYTYNFVDTKCSFSVAGTNLNTATAADIKKFEIAGSTGTWATAPAVDNAGLVTFEMAVYNGASGSTLARSITVQANGDNGTSTRKTIQIHQLAPDMPTASVPSYIGLDYLAKTNYSVGTYAPLGTKLLVTAIPEWITGLTVGTSEVQTGMTFSVAEYTTTDLVLAPLYREGVIELTASNKHFTNVKYYITVRQYSRNQARLSAVKTEYTDNKTHTIANIKIENALANTSIGYYVPPVFGYGYDDQGLAGGTGEGRFLQAQINGVNVNESRALQFDIVVSAWAGTDYAKYYGWSDSNMRWHWPRRSQTMSISVHNPDYPQVLTYTVKQGNTGSTLMTYSTNSGSQTYRTTGNRDITFRDAPEEFDITETNNTVMPPHCDDANHYPGSSILKANLKIFRVNVYALIPGDCGTNSQQIRANIKASCDKNVTSRDYYWYYNITK